MSHQLSFKFVAWFDENGQNGKYHFGFVLDGSRTSLIETDSQEKLEALIAAHFSSLGV